MQGAAGGAWPTRAPGRTPKRSGTPKRSRAPKRPGADGTAGAAGARPRPGFPTKGNARAGIREKNPARRGKGAAVAQDPSCGGERAHRRLVERETGRTRPSLLTLVKAPPPSRNGETGPGSTRSKDTTAIRSRPPLTKLALQKYERRTAGSMGRARKVGGSGEKYTGGYWWSFFLPNTLMTALHRIITRHSTIIHNMFVP